MRNVKPIETGFADDRFKTTYVDEPSASEVVEKYFARPIEELDALASLLGVARKANTSDLYGYDIDYLNEIVLRRIRKLARDCSNNVCRLNDPTNEPVVEDFGPFED